MCVCVCVDGWVFAVCGWVDRWVCKLAGKCVGGWVGVVCGCREEYVCTSKRERVCVCCKVAGKKRVRILKASYTLVR